MKVETFKGSMTLIRYVISQLKDIINMYDCVTVADYYEIIGVNCSYSDSKIGWISLPKVTISMTENENIYELKLPKPLPLNFE